MKHCDIRKAINMSKKLTKGMIRYELGLETKPSVPFNVYNILFIISQNNSYKI